MHTIGASHRARCAAGGATPISVSVRFHRLGGTASRGRRPDPPEVVRHWRLERHGPPQKGMAPPRTTRRTALEQGMKTILIVEDQIDCRELVRMTLEMGDYAVHEAQDGPSALAAAASLKPDLVLLDVMMPGGLNGTEVCARLRQDPSLKRTRIVMLSARDQPQDRMAARQAGADEYLVKPFGPRQLLQTVARLL